MCFLRCASVISLGWNAGYSLALSMACGSRATKVSDMGDCPAVLLGAAGASRCASNVGLGVGLRPRAKI